MQVKGTGMGTNVVLTYANIFVARLEEIYVYVSQHFSNVLGRWRYIDDIFLIYMGGTEELDEFHLSLNSLDDDLTFALTWSYESVQLLDTWVYCMLKKLIDRNTLVRFDSCHPSMFLLMDCG